MDINCGCATGKEDKILFPNAQFAWGKSEISSNSSLLCHSDSFNFTEKKKFCMLKKIDDSNRM